MEYSASAHPHRPVMRVHLCRVGRLMPQPESFLASEYQDVRQYTPNINLLYPTCQQRRQNVPSLQNGRHQLKYGAHAALRHIFFVELTRFRQICRVYILQN